MNPPLTENEARIRCRMILRAFTWDRPLPEGYQERMRRFNSGEDRSEEFWGPDYRLTVEELDAPGIKRKLKRRIGYGPLMAGEGENDGNEKDD